MTPQIGTFDYLEYQFLKRLLYKRDKVCKKCGSKNNLTIHHKKTISKHPELRYEESNCIILCDDCHKKIHNNSPQSKNIDDFDSG